MPAPSGAKIFEYPGSGLWVVVLPSGIKYPLTGETQFLLLERSNPSDPFPGLAVRSNNKQEVVDYLSKAGKAEAAVWCGTVLLEYPSR